MAIEVQDVALLGAKTIAHSLHIAIMARRVWYIRVKHKVDVPETNGPPEFIRTFRAQVHGFFGSVRCIQALAALGMVGIIHTLLKTNTGVDLVTQVKDTFF